MFCVARHMPCVGESRAYYDRKWGQGKRHNRALRELGRHLVRVIWRMLQDDRDYEMRENKACKSKRDVQVPCY